MRILFLSDNFPPEGNAPASRLYEHALEWIKAGHQVTVITCAPNFPEGILFEGYENKWYQVEDMDGIRVVKVKTYMIANRGYRRRTLDYMSFMVNSFVAGLFQSKPDVIVGTSPQFFTVCSAWLLAFVRRKPFVFELRDLWPASIRAMGVVKDGRRLKVLEMLELFFYRQARLIIAVTNAFKEDLSRRGIDSNKIKIVLNGVDQTRYSPQEKDPELLSQFGLTDKFIVGYIGTHGLAHALENVVETAALLRDQTNIAFLFVGGGATRNKLVVKAKSLNLNNIYFVERQPKERMSRIWSLCDVSLIHLKDNAVFSSVIPSKIFESMGMGLPLLLSMPEGEATQIVRNAKAGLITPPENPGKLAQAIINLYENPDECMDMGWASALAAPGYSRAKQAIKMLEELKAVCIEDN